MRPDSVPRHFQLERQLAVGRRCSIQLAQTSDGQPVVLKIPRPEHRTSAALAAEFAAQTVISRAFEHESVVRVLETGSVSGVPYLALEFVAGDNLRRIVERSRAQSSPLGLSVGLRLTLQVCRALAAAHATNRPPLGRVSTPARGDTIVHGDLSLEKLLLTQEGRVRLLPFGCAPPAPSASVTQPSGQVVPLHLAPEVIGGDPPSMASDLWALGAILYELLAPELPEGFRTARGPMGWWRLGLLPPLDQLRPDLPSEVAHLAAHLLEAEPSRRLERAEFVEEELIWALTTHGDRRQPRSGEPPDGEPGLGLEELDLDDSGVVDTLPDDSPTLDDVDDTAGALGIQMIGAKVKPLESAFTDTDQAIEPLRDLARDEGKQAPLVPDQELWIAPEDTLMGQDEARATWMELQAWGESHEAAAGATEDGFGLDGPVLVEEEDDEGLWPTAIHVPTIDGLKALDGPAMAAGLRRDDADPWDDGFGPESHGVDGEEAPTPDPPPAEGPARIAAPPPKKRRRKKKRRKKKRAPQVQAAPPEPTRSSRAEIYFLVASVALFLSAVLLFFSVVLG